MGFNDENQTDVPTIQIRAIGDYHVVSTNVPIGATLKIDGVEVI